MPLRVLVWAAAPEQLEQLVAEITAPGRMVRATCVERELAQWSVPSITDLVVGVDESGFEAQARMIRLPMIVLHGSDSAPSPHLSRQAYAVVDRPGELGFAVERFQEHARLAARAATRRRPPTQCARCGRGYDAQAGRRGPSRRFARFGSVSLCGGCVEALRHLLREATDAFVEAEVRR